MPYLIVHFQKRLGTSPVSHPVLGALGCPEGNKTRPHHKSYWKLPVGLCGLEKGPAPWPQSQYSLKCVSHSVVSDSLGPYGLLPTRLLCPWTPPGKNTRVGCHSLLQENSRPWDWTWVSCIASGFFTVWATREAVIFFERAPSLLILPLHIRDSGPCHFSLPLLALLVKTSFPWCLENTDSSKPGDTALSGTSLPTSLQGFQSPLSTGTTSCCLRLTPAAPALSPPGVFLPFLSLKKKKKKKFQ